MFKKLFCTVLMTMGLALSANATHVVINASYCSVQDSDLVRLIAAEAMVEGETVLRWKYDNLISPQANSEEFMGMINDQLRPVVPDLNTHKVSQIRAIVKQCPERKRM